MGLENNREIGSKGYSKKNNEIKDVILSLLGKGAMVKNHEDIKGWGKALDRKTEFWETYKELEKYRSLVTDILIEFGENMHRYALWKKGRGKIEYDNQGVNFIFTNVFENSYIVKDHKDGDEVEREIREDEIEPRHSMVNSMNEKELIDQNIRWMKMRSSSSTEKGGGGSFWIVGKKAKKRFKYDENYPLFKCKRKDFKEEGKSILTVTVSLPIFVEERIKDTKKKDKNSLT